MPQIGEMFQCCECASIVQLTCTTCVLMVVIEEYSLCDKKRMKSIQATKKVAISEWTLLLLDLVTTLFYLIKILYY